MNIHELGTPRAHARIGARRPIPKWNLPRWEQRLWIGAVLGMGVELLVLSLAPLPNFQIPAPLFVASNLVGIVVWPVMTFLLFRMAWRDRRELALWKGLWLIWLSVAGLLGFFEYALVYGFAIGSSALPILLPSASLLLAIAIFALFVLGFIVFFIELVLRNVRLPRPRAPK